MSSFVSDPGIAHRCNWLACLNVFPKTLASSRSQAQSSSVWPRHATPCVLTAFTAFNYLRGLNFEASFEAATSSHPGMWAGVARRGGG